MATDLKFIRHIETFLHSFFPAPSRDLHDELLWLLDELQEIHTYLDSHAIPNETPEFIPMGLLARIRWLVHDQEGCQDLQDEYNTLEDRFKELQFDHDNLNAHYKGLKFDYNSLASQFAELQEELGRTQEKLFQAQANQVTQPRLLEPRTWYQADPPPIRYPRWRYNYYQIDLFDMLADDATEDELIQAALFLAQDHARTYIVPCEWRAVRIENLVVTVRRKYRDWRHK